MKRLIVCMTLCAFLAQLLPVYAAEGVTVNDIVIDETAWSCTINGQSNVAGEPVKLEVLKEGRTFETAVVQDILYVKQIYTTSDAVDGKDGFAFSFVIPLLEPGMYAARISGMGNTEPIEFSLQTYTEEYVDGLLDDYLTDVDTDGTALANYIALYGSVIGEHCADYIRLSDELFENICADINGDKPADVVELKIQINAYIGVFLKLQTVLWNETADMLKNYLGIDVEKLLDGLSGVQKKQVLEQFLEQVTGTTYVSPSDFENRIEMLADNVADEEEPIERPGGSSGRGGSSRPAGFYTTPVQPYVPPQPVERPEPDEDLSSVSHPFSDMDVAAWAVDAVDSLFAQGIVSGRGDGVFAPMDGVTREEFVKMLMLALDLPTDEGDCGFLDTARDAWYYGYVAGARNQGIVQGLSNIQFGVGRYMTRQEMAAMVYRALLVGEHIAPAKTPAGFSDYNEIDSYAVAAADALYAAGIMRGDNGRFRPESNAVRAEAAVVIYHVMEYLGVENIA